MAMMGPMKIFFLELYSNSRPKKRSSTSGLTLNEDATNLETSLRSLQDVDIKGLLVQQFSNVKNVILRADGKSEEVILDMSPSKSSLTATLGGSITFLGRITAQQTFKLQPPFNDMEIYGDILLIRSDDNGLPLDFLLT